MKSFHEKKKNCYRNNSFKKLQFCDYEIFYWCHRIVSRLVAFLSFILFCRTEKIKYGLCVLFFNIFYILFSLQILFSRVIKCTITSSHSIPWFNMILRVHEVLNWKTSTERIYRGYFSLYHTKEKDDSFALLHRLMSSALPPT